MSQENVEIVRLLADAFQTATESSTGYEPWIDLIGAGPIDPGVEWDPRGVSEAFGVPDVGGVYIGIEGGKAMWSEWLSAWETVKFEYDLVDAGDRVVMLLDQRMKGRATGIDVPLGSYAQVFTFRDGLLTHWKAYASQQDALEAVGLSE